MDQEQRDRLCKQGVALIRSGALSDAALIFRNLVDAGTEDPLPLSYCGLLTAVVHGDNAEGLRFCERALAFGAYEPEVVLNAARVYERVGMQRKAIKLLRSGLREKPRHPGMLARINRLSPRRRPPLSFVKRDQYLNRLLALLLAKLRGGAGAAQTVRQVQSRRTRTATRTRTVS